MAGGFSFRAHLAVSHPICVGQLDAMNCRECAVRALLFAGLCTYCASLIPETGPDLYRGALYYVINQPLTSPYDHEGPGGATLPSVSYARPTT